MRIGLAFSHRLCCNQKLKPFIGIIQLFSQLIKYLVLFEWRISSGLTWSYFTKMGWSIKKCRSKTTHSSKCLLSWDELVMSCICLGCRPHRKYYWDPGGNPSGILPGSQWDNNWDPSGNPSGKIWRDPSLSHRDPGGIPVAIPVKSRPGSQWLK